LLLPNAPAIRKNAIFAEGATARQFINYLAGRISLGCLNRFREGLLGLFFATFVDYTGFKYTCSEGLSLHFAMIVEGSLVGYPNQSGQHCCNCLKKRTKSLKIASISTATAIDKVLHCEDCTPKEM
jgi:hypothetical protein